MKKAWQVKWTEKRKCVINVYAETEEKALDTLYAGNFSDSNTTVISDDILEATATEME